MGEMIMLLIKIGLRDNLMVQIGREEPGVFLSKRCY